MFGRKMRIRQLEDELYAGRTLVAKLEEQLANQKKRADSAVHLEAQAKAESLKWAKVAREETKAREKIQRSMVEQILMRANRQAPTDDELDTVRQMIGLYDPERRQWVENDQGVGSTADIRKRWYAAREGLDTVDESPGYREDDEGPEFGSFGSVPHG